MDVINLTDAVPFTTKDGSEIRELLAHRNSAIRNQSLAEARLPPGGATAPHFHPQAEEIYYLLEGRGRMQIEAEVCEVGPGDAIAIPPGLRHQITAIGDGNAALSLLLRPRLRTHRHRDGRQLALTAHTQSEPRGSSPRPLTPGSREQSTRLHDAISEISNPKS